MSKAIPRAVRVLLCCAALAACSGPSGVARHSTPFQNPAMSMQQADDAVVRDVSTKADVLALLGPARQIGFDSGYAVWVYRDAPGDSESEPAEFVVLFAPSGVVKKTRMRAAYARPTN